MVDSVDKKKKIGSVDKANKLDSVRKSDAVTSVNATGRVSSIDSDPRRPTREMTAAERDAMLALVKKEAEAMFANSNLSKEQTEAIKLAVRQTVDASIIVTDSDDNENGGEDEVAKNNQ